MNEEGKAKYKTFQLYGRTPGWKVALGVVVFFIAGWFIWSTISRTAALRNTPRTDYIGEHGVIEQDTTYTCVPAALAMYLRDAGVDTTQYEITRLAGTDLGGTSDRGIRKALRHFGYKMTIKRMDFREICDYKKPLIIEERFAGELHASYIKPLTIAGMDALQILDPIDGYMAVNDIGFYEYYGKYGSKKKCYLIEKA